MMIPPRPDTDPPSTCALCQRAGPQLTRHHLIPRTRHANKRMRKRYPRAEMERRILWVCRPCHKQIHAVLGEKELAEHYNTRESLLQHPEIRRFVSWIRDRPVDLRVRTSTNRRRR